MKLLLALIAVVALTGCETFVRKEVVVETQYIVRKATDQQKALPPYPAPLNIATANQLELAEWILQNERRQLDLEAIIAELVKFYEAPVAPAKPASAP